MKNLCKIVSFILCLAMVMSLFVVGPSAEVGAGTYTLIDSIEELTAGTYKMAAYLTTGSGSLDLSANPYHLANGDVNSGDLVTTSYAYTNNVLTTTSTDDAADIELIAVAGTTNTYYIKCNDQYLYSTESATNRKLAWGDTATEWVASNYSKGGIALGSNGVTLGTANASSRFLRSYKTATTPAYGVVFFKANIEVEGGEDVIDSAEEYIDLGYRKVVPDDKLYLRYYFQLGAKATGTVTEYGIEYWDHEPALGTDEPSVLNTYGTDSTDGSTYFCLGGLAPHEMLDTQYYRIYIIMDGTKYYSEVKSFSLQMYHDLAIEGGVMTEGDALDELVDAAIAYGTAAKNYRNG